MYFLAAVGFALAAVALAEGGRVSPAVFMGLGVSVLLYPSLASARPLREVVPVNDSILLRRRFFPMRWYALADVKFESPGESRGVSLLDGPVLFSRNRGGRATLILSATALTYGRAEDTIMERLGEETAMLSMRGAHLLPLDSVEAAERLSLHLRGLDRGVGLLSLFASEVDVVAVEARGGVVTKYRGFRSCESLPRASLPLPDMAPRRRPLLAELVEKVDDRGGWGAPDEYAAFLSAMDASRLDPVADRLKLRDEGAGRVTAETPVGAGVVLTRAQLRAVVRAYSQDRGSSRRKAS